MAELSKTAASLRVGGDALQPNEVTKLLGVEPTFQQVKGQVFLGKRTGSKRVAKSGMWSLEAKDQEPGDLNAQIFELLSKATEDLNIWKQLANEYAIDLFCGFFMESGNEGIDLSPKALRALGERNIELAIDIYGE